MVRSRRVGLTWGEERVLEQQMRRRERCIKYTGEETTRKESSERN